MYGESGVAREPGFVVVKKNAETEEGEEKPVADITAKEWEVRLMWTCCSHSLSLLASVNSLQATVCHQCTASHCLACCLIVLLFLI